MFFLLQRKFNNLMLLFRKIIFKSLNLSITIKRNLVLNGLQGKKIKFTNNRTMHVILENKMGIFLQQNFNFHYSNC